MMPVRKKNSRLGSLGCTLGLEKYLPGLRLGNGAFIALALLVFSIDQLSKVWVVRNIPYGESRVLIPHVFHLTHVRNPGAAFGMLPYQTTFFIISSFIMMIILIILGGHFFSPGYRLIRLALALQLGGSLGNLWDRLRTGYVVDFFDFQIWPVFNVADIAIVAGIFFLILSLGKQFNLIPKK